MRLTAMSLVAGLIVVAGCVYESPLTAEHGLAVDPAVLGLWEPVPDEGDEPDQDARMMILKYSDTEYLVHYPTGKDGLYFRAYSVKIGSVSCVQLQLIGTGGGPPKDDAKELFHVVQYRCENGRLEIKTLNSDVVDKGLKESSALQKALLTHKDNKDLFTDPGTFRRVKSQE